jgi:hypothetical protein
MRRFVFVCVLIFLAAVLLAPAPVPAQDGQPILSPPAKTGCKFDDGKTIAVDYSSPRIRERKIYGGLVPWGEVWRVGANEATTFVTNADVLVDGKPVPAGSYTLFAVPTPTKWALIISKKTGEWGIPYPGEQFDFLRADMTVSKLPAALENMTIAFDRAGASCSMRVDWATTRASVQFTEKK